ncbi:hypothetical protein Bint_2304 [Brachyspira intermedia PWS/A]|uniref:Lipoprotein n=1 Tax=Brachyspira intermedia (strain ATCC 51140 / PWS/A) TaxID=1045858 RepID=G0EMD9_BRAIP|nr:hypothetical protein [Brachyspira intermedia]AEM22910.1 hypothetical protein Bint_2304 [Brachyspira intermedia PWS/A]
MKSNIFKFLFVLSLLSFLSVGCGVKDILGLGDDNGIDQEYIGNTYSGKIDSNKSGTMSATITVNSDGSFTLYLGSSYTKFEASNIKNNGNGQYSGIQGVYSFSLEFTSSSVYVSLYNFSDTESIKGTLVR